MSKLSRGASTPKPQYIALDKCEITNADERKSTSPHLSSVRPRAHMPLSRNDCPEASAARIQPSTRKLRKNSSAPPTTRPARRVFYLCLNCVPNREQQHAILQIPCIFICWMNFGAKWVCISRFAIKLLFAEHRGPSFGCARRQDRCLKKSES